MSSEAILKDGDPMLDVLVDIVIWKLKQQVRKDKELSTGQTADNQKIKNEDINSSQRLAKVR